MGFQHVDASYFPLYLPFVVLLFTVSLSVPLVDKLFVFQMFDLVWSDRHDFLKLLFAERLTPVLDLSFTVVLI